VSKEVCRENHLLELTLACGSPSILIQGQAKEAVAEIPAGATEDIAVSFSPKMLGQWSTELSVSVPGQEDFVVRLQAFVGPMAECSVHDTIFLPPCSTGGAVSVDLPVTNRTDDWVTAVIECPSEDGRGVCPLRLTVAEYHDPAVSRIDLASAEKQTGAEDAENAPGGTSPNKSSGAGVSGLGRKLSTGFAPGPGMKRSGSTSGGPGVVGFAEAALATAAAMAGSRAVTKAERDAEDASATGPSSETSPEARHESVQRHLTEHVREPSGSVQLLIGPRCSFIVRCTFTSLVPGMFRIPVALRCRKPFTHECGTVFLHAVCADEVSFASEFTVERLRFFFASNEQARTQALAFANKVRWTTMSMMGMLTRERLEYRMSGMQQLDQSGSRRLNCSHRSLFSLRIQQGGRLR
jgi:hypothetical protein